MNNEKMKKVSFPRGVFPITPVERLLLVFCTVILLLVGTHCGQPDSSVTANLLLSPGGSWDAEQQFFQVLPIRMYVGDAHDARTLAISPYFRWTDKNGIVVEREGNQIRGTISSLKSPGTDSIVLSPYLGGNLMARSDIASNSVRVDLWVRVIIFSSDLRYLDDITSKTWINFWPATASQTVNVEYDHQVGYNVFGTTSEADTTIKLKISGAFTVADQKLIFNADQRNLAVESIFWDPDPTRRRGAFTLYVNVNRNQTASNPAYLVAVKNTTGNPVEKVAGYTLEPWTAQDHSTFMFVEYINQLSNPTFVEAVPQLLAHEFGHQFVSLTHASGEGAQKNLHNSAFCAMNYGLGFAGDNDNSDQNDPPTIFRTFYQNPYFCPNDVNLLYNFNP